MTRPTAQPVKPREPLKGFTGSKLPGHRDVPELGWWRPTTEECRGEIIREYARKAKAEQR
jgi:hypothetical protein